MEPIHGPFANADVDSSEEILSVRPRGRRMLWVSFTTTVDLTAFTVEGNLDPAEASGNFFTLASAAVDYTTPEGPILGASGDLTTAAAGGGTTVHWLRMDVDGLHTIRLKAASTSASIAGRWVLN
jgi:hypothetical protein